MEEGSYCYDIETEFPLGKQHGKLRLEISKGYLHGALRLLGHWNPFSEGKIENGKLSFCGQLSALLFVADYTASGTVDEKHVDFCIRLPSGIKHFTGAICANNDLSEGDSVC